MSFKQFTNKTKFFVKKNAPTIMCVGGFALCTVGAIFAVKKAPKAHAAKVIAKQQIDMYKQCEADGTCVNDEGNIVEYSHEDAKQDIALTKGSLIREYLKDFTIPALLYAGGGAMIFAGNHINNKRLQASYAAYAGLAAAYANYRTAVKKELGEEKEGELYGGKLEDHGCTITDMSTGETTEIKDLRIERDETGYSPLAYKFDESNKNWHPSFVYNRNFIEGRLQMMNDKYQHDGRLTWNEVLKIGYDVPDKYLPIEGQFFGWDIDLPGCPKYIDLGLNANTPVAKAFMKGDINFMVLDPNCVNIYYTFPKVTK